MMKKQPLLLSILLLIGMVFSTVSAQDAAISEEFPSVLYKNYFNQAAERKYYRFPTLVYLYDPLDLTYFPHDFWWEYDWNLLNRWDDGYTYNQLILLDRPREDKVIHGTDVGRDYGLLGDFYLYITLFTVDNYPEETGSCYVYYSDSLSKGYGLNTGIFIDPMHGVYKSNNSYRTDLYWISNNTHEWELLKELHPDDYPIIQENVPAYTYAGNDFVTDNLNSRFWLDWQSVENGFRMPGSSIKVWRIELVRRNTNTEIYINGFLAYSFDDGIVKTDEEGNTIPDMVSWSYGPVLYPGGTTVTCAVGDVMVMGKNSQGSAEK